MTEEGSWRAPRSVSHACRLLRCFVGGWTEQRDGTSLALLRCKVKGKSCGKHWKVPKTYPYIIHGRMKTRGARALRAFRAGKAARGGPFARRYTRTGARRRRIPPRASPGCSPGVGVRF